MKVEIERPELLLLCRGIEIKGPVVGFAQHFEKRPFVNGTHWRLTEAFLNTATDEQLFDLYSTHSETIKLL
jgi:hypothetical protein